ncbi:phosphodiesterase [Clostridium sp. C8-1-8]|uniref:putative bifunctional diguanylate cyclase/phosphodiesterase n=1 Tax=Clostridium sp. C8-1-8 TaxID=2698831 RepID=UPI0013721A63|nr:phosphodiesterase [Clostridium sp. C8-1-8]
MKKLSSIYKISSGDIDEFLEASYRIDPKKQSLKVALAYAVAGVVWIIISDTLLDFWAERDSLYESMQTYKGWIFVLLTTLVIYISIRNSLMLFDKAIGEIYDNYEELNESHKTLIKLENEIERQLQELHVLAFYDSLTKLPNKILFEKQVTNLIESIDKKYSNKSFAFICLTIDNLKDINDVLGHNYGDLFIKNIGYILKHMSDSDIRACRLKENEFGMIINSITNNEQVLLKIKKILSKLNRAWRVDSQEFFITYSLGVSIYPKDANDFNGLLKNSNMALSHSKSVEKDEITFYSKKIQENNIAKINLINDIIHAIESRQFTLYYQPIVRLDNNKLIGVEVLIRWIHPKKGFISPMEFIPIAESIGLISDIESWVFYEAIRQKSIWQSHGYPPIKMSINLSSERLGKLNIIEELSSLVEKFHINKEEVQLEVTETSVIGNLNTAFDLLSRLKNMGFKIALDDFGSGYSSLTYVSSLPIDVVKIDKEFIKSSMIESKDKIIVKTIIELMHNLGMVVVAEGIETEEQKEFLKSNACDMGQGYFYSKPVPANDIVKKFF